ncbi:MAG: WxcM-like domain-containing protein [Bacteroidaceae bacterium]|jgi:dTDP-4-dehydrorhamnose 3,5-epimerase-like enzyme|nr:WxcM-like domain-containing protein [Bacteroidaceae bacterium]
MQHLTTHTDVRGSLTIVEEQCDFPFTMQRAYWIHGVPEGARRGYHASTSCHEFLIAVHGGVTVVLEDASGRTTTRLCEKDQGLHVPPYTWIELSDFTADAVLMVLASESYQIETYINDHEQFLAVVGNHTVG